MIFGFYLFLILLKYGEMHIMSEDLVNKLVVAAMKMKREDLLKYKDELIKEEIEAELLKKINLVDISENIVNPHDFEYLLNPGIEFCQNQKNLFLLIYVHTDPRHLKRRIMMRETWAKQSMFRDIKTVFMMGALKDHPLVMESVKLEQNIYNDIVQENFEDSYRNLTYKGIAALKWITHYCANAKFILKVDDDIITDIFVLLKHLKSQNDHNSIKPRTIMCHLWNKSTVFRDKNEKWFLTKGEHEQDWFGKYCSGSAFVLTNDLALEMFRISFYVKFFWIDDYYISGLLPRAIGANYEQLNSLYTLNPNIIEKKFMQTSSPTQVFGHSPSKIDCIFNIWNFILSNYMKLYPKLTESPSSFLFEDDFFYVEKFEWSSEIVFKDVNTRVMYRF